MDNFVRADNNKKYLDAKVKKKNRLDEEKTILCSYSPKMIQQSDNRLQQDKSFIIISILLVAKTL